MFAFHSQPSPTSPAPSTSPPTDVHFPPRQLCDFAIHYIDATFHVHKFLLHAHSAYFRALFDTLPPPGTPTEQLSGCNHPAIALCVHIPVQTQPVTQSLVRVDSFRLFLCHLYFPAHYRYPPYLPHGDVDLDAETTPQLLPHSSPPLQQSELRLHPAAGQPGRGKLRAPADAKARNSVVFDESLLALAYYFDCPLVLQRCEEVATLFLSGTCSVAAVANDLRFAAQYRMARWQQRCLQLTPSTPRPAHECVSFSAGGEMFEEIGEFAMHSAML